MPARDLFASINVSISKGDSRMAANTSATKPPSAERSIIRFSVALSDKPKVAAVICK